VSLKHNLLGDFLDPEELMSAVYGLAFVADDVDDELKAKFGGLRFHEDEDEAPSGSDDSKAEDAEGEAEAAADDDVEDGDAE
ncbi:MAG: hypothetical protein QM658_17985, partial [Gordonia sp. (in: high G+C Gram-positive bacteria)]